MDNHWRNTMRPARFIMGLDARAALPFLLVLTDLFALWSWTTAIVITAVFYILEQRGLTFDAGLRAMRAWLLGPHRPRILSKSKTKFTDYAERY